MQICILTTSGRICYENHADAGPVPYRIVWYPKGGDPRILDEGQINGDATPFQRLQKLTQFLDHLYAQQNVRGEYGLDQWTGFSRSDKLGIARPDPAWNSVSVNR